MRSPEDRFAALFEYTHVSLLAYVDRRALDALREGTTDADLNGDRAEGKFITGDAISGATTLRRRAPSRAPRRSS